MYIGLDGQEYGGKEAARQCIVDKQSLDKLAETTRLMQSPSYQYALQQKLGNIAGRRGRGDGDGDGDGSSSLDVRSTLSHWAVPPEIVQNYALKGVRSLYQWQMDCLSELDATSSRTENLLYCAPTSGGKTLISEVLMIRRILLQRKKCLLI